MTEPRVKRRYVRDKWRQPPPPHAPADAIAADPAAALVQRPWSVQIELTEGCTRLCSFCGLNAIRTKPGGFKPMTLDTALLVAEQAAALAPWARYEFAMHGEPLANRQAVEVVATFRALLPKAQLQMTTNGQLLRGRMREKIVGLFDAGLDYVIIDTYREDRDDLRAEAATLGVGITVRDFYADLAPSGWSPWGNHRRFARRLVVLMDDLGLRDRERASRKVLNHAGASPARPVPEAPLRKNCSNPFRELAVTWNGEVRLCCIDWRGDYVCGVADRDETLTDIWWGWRFMAARRLLASKDRRFAPCGWCDKDAGTRAFLLPKMPKPYPDDAEVAVRATAGGPVGAAWPRLCHPPAYWRDPPGGGVD
jgi:hypothetical protein